MISFADQYIQQYANETCRMGITMYANTLCSAAGTTVRDTPAVMQSCCWLAIAASTGANPSS